MITLSFPWLIALIVLLFFTTLVLMACYKSPMRKWVCFGLSAVSIAYLLYIMVFQQHDPALKLDWFLLGVVGVFAALSLSGVGFMDLVKPKLVTSVPCSDNDKEEPFADLNGDDEDELSDSDKDGVNNEKDNEKKVMESTALSWFCSQLYKFTEDEQNAIKESAIVFVHDGTIKSPSVTINNTINGKSLYSQPQLIEICCALRLLNKGREEVANYIINTFKQTFKETELSTVMSKLIGRNAMQIKIDRYLESEQISKNPSDSI